MTRSSSTATKRRGVAIAAAVGVLTLGATASASAAGPSHTASKASADAGIAAKGLVLCVATADKPVPDAKTIEVEFTEGVIEPTEAAKATEAAKITATAKVRKAVKFSPSVVRGPHGRPVHAWKCPVPPSPGEPGKPGKPGKWCRVLAVKGAGTVWKKDTVTDCDATLAPATPKKR
ncbi:hypothetical protein [Streptomyces cuspidosporus]|uniref:Uncharacterized protein n=1 Tax=Streptomyces cuspidosporus TaxID=66882 RepID=A0ABN3GFJ8_9ACTN